MNGTSNRYLFDTNIFIYYFNGEAAVQAIVSEVLAEQATGYYCPVSWAELLCYPALTEEEANQIRNFLRLFTSVSLSGTGLLMGEAMKPTTCKEVMY